MQQQGEFIEVSPEEVEMGAKYAIEKYKYGFSIDRILLSKIANRTRSTMAQGQSLVKAREEAMRHFLKGRPVSKQARNAYSQATGKIFSARQQIARDKLKEERTEPPVTRTKKTRAIRVIIDKDNQFTWAF